MLTNALINKVKLGELADFQSLNNQDSIFKESTDKQVTLLHVAALYGHLELMKLLIAKGCDVNARNQLGATPLHCSLQLMGAPTPELLNNKEACYRHLVSLEGVNIDSVTNEKENIAHFMAVGGFNDLLKELINDPAHAHLLTAKNANQGFTPLHKAVLNKKLSEDTLQALAQYPNLANISDNKGKTPIFHALNDSDLFEQLLAAGSDVAHINREGKSLSELAKLLKKTDIRDKITGLLQASQTHLKAP